MPAEPEDSTYKEKFRHVAYRVEEAGGIVWAFMGAGAPPPLPNFDWIDLPPGHALFLRAVARCNWAQALEGAIDSAHQTYLHDARSRIEPATAPTSSASPPKAASSRTASTRPAR